MSAPRAAGGSAARRFLLRSLAHAAAAWWILAAASLVPALSLPSTAWNEPLLTGAERASLVARELLLLLPAALALGAALAAARAGRLGRARAPLTAGLLGAALLLYLASWAAFRTVGQFLDGAALAFWAHDAGQVLRHALSMDPYGTLGVPLLALAAGGAYALAAPRGARAPRSARRAGAAATAVALAACLAAAKGVERRELLMRGRAVHPELGVDVRVVDLFASVRAERTGPLLHAAAALRARSAAPDGASGAALLERHATREIVPVGAWTAAHAGRVRRRPNVVLVLVEALRSDQLVATGGDRVVMPTVEALAREGRVFTRHYSASSHSNYADLVPLSGHYPLRSPYQHVYPRDPGYPRVPVYDVLKALGYRTAVVSSQNENWGGMLNWLSTPGLDDLLHSANYTGPTYVPRADVGFAAFVKGEKRAGKVDDRFTVDRAIRWVDGVGEAPFFVYMNLQNSHVPYEVPADFPPRFGSGRVSFQIGFNQFPRDSVQAVKDVYANSLAYMDAQIARFVAHLKAKGVWENTVLVVGGDNGEAFFEHGFAAHANALYDEVVHTPMVIRGPGVPAGADDRLAATVDLPSTLLGVLGLPPHPGWQGVDLLGPPPAGERSVFLVAQTPLAHQYAVVRGRHKLIHDVRRGHRLLYDLAADPGERRDLASARPEVVRELSGRLDRWVAAQLAYYQTPSVHRRRYPPVLPD